MRLLVTTNDMNRLRYLTPDAMRQDSIWQEVTDQLQGKLSKLAVATDEYEVIVLSAVLPESRKQVVEESPPKVSSKKKNKELWVDFVIDLSPWMFDKSRATLERAQIIEKLRSRAWGCLVDALGKRNVLDQVLPDEISIEIELPLYDIDALQQVRRQVSAIIEAGAEILESSIGPRNIQYTLTEVAFQTVKAPVEAWLNENFSDKWAIHSEAT